MSSEVLRDSAVIAVTKFYLLDGPRKRFPWQLIFFIIFDHQISNVDFVDISLLLHRVYRPFRAENSALWFWAVGYAAIKNSIQVGFVLTETLAVKEIFFFIWAFNLILVSRSYPFALEYLRNAHPLGRFHNQHRLYQMFCLIWDGHGVLEVSF